MRPLSIAVVGAGYLGRFHARILAAMPDVTLVGVVDPSDTQRRAVAEECRTQGFAHARELPHVDAVVLATPTRAHHALGMELLERGVHLLVEKPLATTLAEAEALVELAGRRGLVLQTGHVERFNPIFTAAQPHLREPKYIEACRAAAHKFRSTDIGVVLDLMIHDIDLVLSIVRSPVKRVEALGVSLFGRHEDVANARLVFENGCVATLNASRASYQAHRTMHVWTPRGFTSLNFADRQATVVRPHDSILRRQMSVETLDRAEIDRLKDHLFEDLLPLEQITAEPRDQLTAELEDFAASIREARAPRVSGAAGRDALAVAEMVLASMATHAWDGTADGRTGPLAEPAIIPGPHWHRSTAPAAVERPRKQAG